MRKFFICILAIFGDIFLVAETKAETVPQTPEDAGLKKEVSLGAINLVKGDCGNCIDSRPRC